MRPLITTSVTLHRWAGIFFGLPALLWFGSIFAMHLWAPHFDLTQEQRLRAFGPPLQPGELGRVGAPPGASGGRRVAQAALHRVLDRLVWELQLEGGATAVVDAATGEARGTITPADAVGLAAAAESLSPAGARVELISQYDLFYYYDGQGGLPAYRVRFRDPARTDAYVDPTTGAVTTAMDRTGRRYRVLGTLLHFSQFWPLDRHHTVRDTLRFLGLTGNLVSAACGVVFALWLFAHRRRAFRRRWTLKNGIRQGHYWLGVVLCVVFVLWAASGYLMFLWFRTVAPSPEERARLRGAALEPNEYATSPAAAVALAARSAGEPPVVLRARRLLDRPVYDAIRPSGHSTLIDGASGALLAPLPDSLVRGVATRFLQSAPVIQRMTLLDRYDAYYYGRGADARPLPVYRVDVANPGAPSPIYIDAETDMVTGRVDRAYRVFRWVGQGLHTFDFPPLADHPTLQDAAILVPALGGTVLSLTGLWLGVSYLLRLAALGSSTSRRPSPTRLNPSTVSMMNTPGTVESQTSVRR